MLTPWSELLGKKCELCGELASHIYKGKYMCCQCHNKDNPVFTVEQIKLMHQLEELKAKEVGGE